MEPKSVYHNDEKSLDKGQSTFTSHCWSLIFLLATASFFFFTFRHASIFFASFSILLCFFTLHHIIADIL